MEESGKVYVGQGKNNSIPNLALVSDIEKARSRWLNKTIWLSDSHLSTYDADTDRVSRFDVVRYRPYKVKDVVLGWSFISPCRLVLETLTGEQGYVDVVLSGTCAAKDANSQYRVMNQPYSALILSEDPHKTYNWPEKVWKAIESGRVIAGMTMQQVLFTWGEPLDRTKIVGDDVADEKWYYRAKQLLEDVTYVYFKNGVTHRDISYSP